MCQGTIPGRGPALPGTVPARSGSPHRASPLNHSLYSSSPQSPPAAAVHWTDLGVYSIVWLSTDRQAPSSRCSRLSHAARDISGRQWDWAVSYMLHLAARTSSFPPLCEALPRIQRLHAARDKSEIGERGSKELRGLTRNVASNIRLIWRRSSIPIRNLLG